MKITFLLGGLGKRSRRGFGSTNITYDGFSGFNSEKSLNKFITDILSKVKTTNLYPTIRHIQIGKSKNNYKDILINIGKQTHLYPFRPLNKIDNETVKRYASPIYVSIVKVNELYYPIVTELTYNISNFTYQNFGKFKIETIS